MHRRRFLPIALLCLLPGLPAARAQQVVSTPGGGTVRVFTDHDGLPGNTVRQVLQTRDGFLWIVAEDGIVRFDGYAFEPVGAAYGVPYMKFIYHDEARDELWFADSTALVHFDGNAFTRYEAGDGYRLPGAEDRAVATMLRDRDGTLWIGTRGDSRERFNGGVLRFRDGTFTSLDSTAFPLHDARKFVQTADGSLWVTSEGLIADGGSTESWTARYHPEEDRFERLDDAGFPHARTFHVDEDAQGNVWFFSSGHRRQEGGSVRYEQGGVLRYDGRRFVSFPEVQARLTDGSFLVDGLFHTPAGTIFAAFGKSFGSRSAFTAREMTEQVLAFRDGAWQVEAIAGAAELLEQTGAAPDEAVFFGYGFLAGHDGTLYTQVAMGRGPTSVQKPMHMLRDGRWQAFDRLEQTLAPAIYSDMTAVTVALRGGGLALHNASNGFALYHPGRSRLFAPGRELLDELAFNAFFETVKGNGYAAAAGDVWITYGSRYQEERARSRGVSLWDGRRIRAYGVADGLPSGFVEPGLLQDSQGRVWLPTDRGVARAERRGGSHHFTTIPAEGGGPYWTDRLLEQRDGTIWAWNAHVDDEALFFLGRYDGRAFERIPSPLPDSLRDAEASLRLAEDRGGRLWLTGNFSSADLGRDEPLSTVHLYEAGRWRAIPERWQVPAGLLIHAGGLSDGDYFLADGDLYRFDGTRFRKLNIEGEDLSTVLRRLEPADRYVGATARGDTLFMAFWGKGILAVHGGAFRLYDRQSGLPTLPARPPVKTPGGDLLFVTSRGAMLYNGHAFLLVRDDIFVTGDITAGAMDANGDLLLVYPGKGVTLTHLNEERLPLRLSAMRVDDAVYGSGTRPRLAHDQNNVRLEFSALDMSRPDAVWYSYYLEGVDREWSGYAPQRLVEYKNLPPRDYVFRVRALSGDGVPTEALDYAFTIAPPFWRTKAAYLVYLMLAGGLFFSFIQYRDERVRRHSQARLEQDREQARIREAVLRAEAAERELAQAREIEQAYHELKGAQDRLVQQEKMASLGALTAGIAHEIKNPLNFVNNFSALMCELVAELRQEVDGLGGAADAARMQEIAALLSDLEINAGKIEEHGKRADGIVRSMLEHSRGGKGERQETDINRLVEEYANLAYHGMRAQVADFDVQIERDYDDAVGHVELVSQEMGRVLLNLLNNAFQAVHEHRQRLGDPYEPAVRVSTRRQNGQVEIRVEDNGAGIPEEIRGKIFEPFFTTKPTGSGTGLGLSMSHDIVVQGHGGTLAVESREGEGAAFTISLPA